MAKTPAKPKARRPAPKKRRASARKAGRPKGTGWIPTPEQRRLVEHCAAIGYTQEQTALVLDVSVDSLDRHCRRELDSGKAKVNAQVAGKLFTKAMAGDTASMIFWLKTQARWKDPQYHEHTGKDGAPIEYRDLSEDEIDARIAALAEHRRDPRMAH